MKIIRGKTAYRRRKPEGQNENRKSYCRKPMKISPELQACRKVNQGVNDKKIHFVDTVNDARDRRLIKNILNRAFM